jgi:hypothetical protein
MAPLDPQLSTTPEPFDLNRAVPAPADDRPARRGLRLHWWAAIPAALALGMILIATRDQWGSAYGAGRAVGAVAGAILISLLLAWVASICSRRSPTASSATFSVVILLAGVGQLNSSQHFRQRQRDRQAMNAVKSANAQLRERARQAAETDETIDIEGEVNKAAAVMERSADMASGENAVTMRISGPIMRELGRLGAEYQAAVRTFTESGGIEVGPETSREELRARRTHVEAAQPRIKAHIQFVADLPTTVREALATEGVPAKRRDLLVQEYLMGAKQSILLDAYRQEEALLSLFDGRLNLLVTRWETMTLPEEVGGTILFEDDADSEAFNANLAAINALIEQQQATHARLGR